MRNRLASRKVDALDTQKQFYIVPLLWIRISIRERMKGRPGKCCRAEEKRYD